MPRNRVRGCEALMSLADADRLQATVEEATGEKCPCWQGEPCPFAPKVVRLVRKLPTAGLQAAAVFGGWLVGKELIEALWGQLVGASHGVAA